MPAHMQSFTSTGERVVQTGCRDLSKLASDNNFTELVSHSCHWEGPLVASAGSDDCCVRSVSIKKLLIGAEQLGPLSHFRWSGRSLDPVICICHFIAVRDIPQPPKTQHQTNETRYKRQQTNRRRDPFRRSCSL